MASSIWILIPGKYNPLVSIGQSLTSGMAGFSAYATVFRTEGTLVDGSY